MSTPADTFAIAYNSWSTGSTGVYKHDVHSYKADAESVVVSFVVILQHDTSEATLKTYMDALETAFKAENKRLTITSNGTTLHDLTGDLSSLPVSGVSAAQFVRCDWELLPTHRSALSRAYRVTVTAALPATQSGKTAKRDQSIHLATSPEGWRFLEVAISFTPGATDGTTALDNYADGSIGFDARVATIKAAIDGSAAWERVAPLDLRYDEDERALTASAVYRELIFAQGPTSVDDATLVGATYTVEVVRREGRSADEFGDATPYAEVTVSFSSGVAYDGSETDLDDAVTSLALVHIRDTIVNRLSYAGEPVLMGHSLRVEPMSNRISGQVFYLVREGNILAASVSTQQVVDEGVVLVAIANGDPYARDRHDGPKSDLLSVTLAVEAEGDAVAELEAVQESVIALRQGEGYVLKRRLAQSDPVLRTFQGASIRTTTLVRQLLFERANVLDGDGNATDSGSSGGTVGNLHGGGLFSNG